LTEKLLEVTNLRTTFKDKDGNLVPAVDGISFYVSKGETLGIVGESGCGKSVTMLSVMQLINIPPGRIDATSISLEGRNLLQLTDKEMQKVRGNEISMIFQEPMTSLNPVFTVGDQVAETVALHQGLSKAAALAKAVEMLKKVGIPAPERRAKEYPHQLSGGMRQRVMIAMALACNPKLLIADEPTTALDVTIQAQILELIKSLRDELEMSVVLITHDLGVVAETADRVIVMYAGKIVEEADTLTLFNSPQHPYTEGLLNSIPKLTGDSSRLYVIEGVVPHPLYMPTGCRFNPRCAYAEDKCRNEAPELMETSPTHKVSCFFPLSPSAPQEVSA